MDRFWDWLIGEAGAGWIIGLLGVLYALWQRERPNRVVLHEVENQRLLDIHTPEHEKLEILYTSSNGEQIKIQDLHQKKVVVYHTGTRDINDPLQLLLKIREKGTFNEFEKFFQISTNDPLCLVNIEKQDDDSQIVVDIPYLNTYDAHEHHVEMLINSDGEVDLELIRGRGRGWSARHVSLDKIELVCARTKQTMNLLIGLVVVLFFLALFSTPGFAVFLEPTSENAEAAVQAYRESMELRIRGGASMEEYSRIYGDSYFFITVYYFLFMILLLLRSEVIRRAPYTILGIRSNKKFVSTPEIPKRWRRIANQISEFLASLK